MIDFKVIEMDDLISEIMAASGSFSPEGFEAFWNFYKPFAIHIRDTDWLIWDRWGKEVLQGIGDIMGGMAIVRIVDMEGVYIFPYDLLPPVTTLN